MSEKQLHVVFDIPIFIENCASGVLLRAMCDPPLYDSSSVFPPIHLIKPRNY